MQKLIAALIATLLFSACTNKAQDFAQLTEKETITYKGSQTKETLYVFFDPLCTYCRNFIQEIPELNRNNIEVKIILIANYSRSKEISNRIWCNKDQKQAIVNMIQGHPFSSNQCISPIEKNTMLSRKMAIKGTPAVFNSKGQYIGGYTSAENYIKHISAQR